MTIVDAQREMRTRYVGGFYGQLVSGLIWLASAALAVWSSPRAAIVTLVAGGFFIFAITELLVRTVGASPLSAGNSLRQLGMQVAFVLPFSMLLLIPVAMFRLAWFYPGLMILLGAHYLPFAFLYGMRMFLALAGLLVGGGVIIAMNWPNTFSVGAWYTAVTLLVFAGIGWMVAHRQWRGEAAQPPVAAGGAATYG